MFGFCVNLEFSVVGGGKCKNRGDGLRKISKSQCWVAESSIDALGGWLQKPSNSEIVVVGCENLGCESKKIWKFSRLVTKNSKLLVA